MLSIVICVSINWIFRSNTILLVVVFVFGFVVYLVPIVSIVFDIVQLFVTKFVVVAITINTIPAMVLMEVVGVVMVMMMP